jgi:hypothetical protein
MVPLRTVREGQEVILFNREQGHSLAIVVTPPSDEDLENAADRKKLPVVIRIWEDNSDWYEKQVLLGDLRTDNRHNRWVLGIPSKTVTSAQRAKKVRQPRHTPVRQVRPLNVGIKPDESSPVLLLHDTRNEFFYCSIQQQFIWAPRDYVSGVSCPVGQFNAADLRTIADELDRRSAATLLPSVVTQHRQ